MMSVDEAGQGENGMQNETLRIEPKAVRLTYGDALRHGNPESEINHGSFHCLVVDDDNVCLNVVSEMIEALGHQADRADNGSLAFHKFAANGHNVVVTDLDMPDMDGYVLAERIKEESENAKIVIMTGRSQAEVFELQASETADAWLFKPFGINELVETLDTLKSGRDVLAGR